MHEHSLMENILESVQRDLAGRGIDRAGVVQEVHITIGALEIHSEESFAQAFTVASRGTLLAGARLTLTVVPATLVCAHCGHSGRVGDGDADGHLGHLTLPVAECPLCKLVGSVSGGRGVGPIELVLRE